MSRARQCPQQALANLLAWDHGSSAAISRRLAPPDSWAHQALTVVAHTGDGVLWAALGAILLAFGSPRTRSAVWRAALGVLCASAGVMALKHVARRERPCHPPSTERALWSQRDPYSFPSGHSARLMATAVTLGRRPGILLGLWSGLVGLARVSLGVHYLLDVLVGLGVGGVTGGLANWLAALQHGGSTGGPPQYW